MHASVYQVDHNDGSVSAKPLRSNVYRSGLRNKMVCSPQADPFSEHKTDEPVSVPYTNTLRCKTVGTISNTNDPYEIEADCIAEQLMRIPLTVDEPGHTFNFGSIFEREGTSKAIRNRQYFIPPDKICRAAQPSFKVNPLTASGAASQNDRLSLSSGSGRPLPCDVAQWIGSHINADFKDVRIHTDSYAAKMARRLNAQAFTCEKDVYFGDGKFNTKSNRGLKLLAHELVHVAQYNQRKGSPINASIYRKEAIESIEDRVESRNLRPDEVPDSDARALAIEYLRKVDYETIMRAAIEAGFIETRQHSGSSTGSAEPHSGRTIFRQAEAVTFGAVFSRYAVAAGVASQLDSPAPGPGDLVGIGILLVGLAVAGYTVYMASPGNVADTGIMAEVNSLIAAGTAATICAALELLMRQAEAAGDTQRIQRIKATQKAKNCRHSRHS